MKLDFSIRLNWLWLILGGAFVARLAAFMFGMPLNLAGDEFVHVVAAFSYLEDMTLRTLNPLVYAPSLLGILIMPFVAVWGGFLILAGAVDGIAGLKEYAILNAVYFIPVGRLISAVSGVVFVYMLFLITRRITTERVALAAAALAAVDFWLVHESQLAHFWMPGVSLVAVGFYMLLKLAETGALRFWYEAIATTILGFWMGYFPVILAPFLALAHWHSPERRNWRRLWWGGGVLAALFVLVAWLNPTSFLKQFGRAIKTALDPFGISLFPQYHEAATVPTEPLSNLGLFIKLLALDNPFVFALGLLGMAALVWKRGWRDFYVQLVVGFFFAYLVAAAFIWSHPDNRYILPLLLPLYIGAAYAIANTWEWARVRQREMRYVAAAFMGLAAFYSLYTTLTYGWLLQRDDTRLLAREWIIENVSSEEVVLAATEYFELPRSQAAIRYLEKYLPESLRSHDRVTLGLSEYRLPQPAYFFVNTEYAEMLARRDALPVSAYIVTGFYDPADKPSISSEQYKRIAAWYPRNPSKQVPELIINPENPFAVRGLSRLGPHIEIFRRVE